MQQDGSVLLEKECPEHGHSSVPVWRGRIDYREWRGDLPETPDSLRLDCPNCAGICGEHQQGTCCALLEVTRLCELNCRFCFADGSMPEPELSDLKADVDRILELGGRPLIQFSGGEPTMRGDLPELIAYAAEKGAPYTQVNSNGIRLAEDEGYVKALADAGLSFVFMQFDGVDDRVYKTLRGRPLLETKLKAIEMCGRYNVGVTLVPTVVRGVNDGQIGDIIRLAGALSPAMRGVHFQPVSYFGRYPDTPGGDERYTLDELLAALRDQAGVMPENILQSRCDHPLCGFHGSFIALPGGELVPLSKRGGARAACGVTTAKQNRDYIGSRWKRGPVSEQESASAAVDITSLDDFIKYSKTRGFTISAMAFQDAMNLDIERLRRCSLHVYKDGVLMPFCARYLTPMEESARDAIR